MKSALDAIALLIIACALSLASGGRWIVAFAIYLALMWLYVRIKPRPITFSESLVRLPRRR